MAIPSGQCLPYAHTPSLILEVGPRPQELCGFDSHLHTNGSQEQGAGPVDRPRTKSIAILYSMPTVSADKEAS